MLYYSATLTYIKFSVFLYFSVLCFPNSITRGKGTHNRNPLQVKPISSASPRGHATHLGSRQ